VGDSSFSQVQENEITSIQKGLEKLKDQLKIAGYMPKLAYFIVTKLIKDRFFV